MYEKRLPRVRLDDGTWPTMRVEVVDGGAQHRGLAGAGWPNNEDEPVLPGDSAGGVGLQYVEPVRGDGGG